MLIDGRSLIMPIFKDYDANGNLLEVRQEPLTIKNINRFINEYGAEKARVYLEAIKEFTDEIYGIIYPLKGQDHVEATQHFVKKDARELYYNKDELLEKVKPLIYIESDDANKLDFPPGAEKFETLLKEQGTEMAQVRFDALDEFNHEIYWIIHKLKGPHHVEATPHSVKRDTHKLYDEKVELLEAVKPLLSGLDKGNKTPDIQP
jgi:hypothetical protein